MIRTSRSADRVKVTFALPLESRRGALQCRRRLQRVDPGQPRAAQAGQRHPLGVGDRAARDPAALPLPGRGRQLVQRPRRGAPRRRRQRGGRLSGCREARRRAGPVRHASERSPAPRRVATRSTGNDRAVDSDLIELAAAHGVATSYRDGERKIVEVDEDVVVRILGLLDVDAAEPEARTAALALRPGEGGAGRAAGHDRAPASARSRPLPGPGVLIDAEGTRIDVTELPDDLGPGLLPAGAGRRAARPRGHRGRGAGRAAGDAAVVGLDAAALRAALRRVVGHRRPRRPARVRRAGPAASTAPRRCCSTRCTRSPRCRRCRRRPTRRRAGGSRRRWRCASPTSTPTAPPTTTPAPRWTRCARTPPATGSSTTGCGRPSARPASCCGARRGGPSPSAHRTTCGSSRCSARSPSATGAGGAGGRRGCGTPRRRTSTARACELAPRVAFHAWLQDQVQRQLSDVRGGGAGGRGAGRARPRRRLRPGGRRRLGAAGRPRAGRARRRAAGRVQPAGPGLGAAAVAPRPAGRHRLRRLPRPAARAAAARRRAADRPRRRAVAAVVGAAGRVAGPRHVRALRLRGHARGAHAGGVAGRARW